MNPKEKAVELVDLMFEKIYGGEGLSAKPFIYERAKDCALVAVELRLSGNFFFSSIEVGGDDSSEFWHQVYSEIKKLRSH